jgi:hypothetical protein
MTRITGTLHEDPYTLMIISHSVLLRVRNVSEKNVKKIETNCMFSNLLWEMVPFMRYCGKILQSRTGHRWQYGACALHAG